MVSAKSPVKTLPELIALGKQKNLTYATPGCGQHRASRRRAVRPHAGFRVTHVAYRGVAPALTDVLRGEIGMMFAQVSTAKPLIDSGELRALGVASARRSAALPDVPTIAEQRHAGLRGGLLVCADGAGRHPGRRSSPSCARA